MAGGYACTFGEDNHGAEVLMTWLSTGATVALCGDDFGPALINMLAVDLGVDPTRFYDGVRRLVDREAKRQADGTVQDTDGSDDPAAGATGGESTPPPVTGRDVLLASLAGDLADSIPADDDA